MVSLSSRISPFTSTVILRDKSPRATAVATSAMLRTWPVKLLAMKFTLSVRSFHVPAPGTCAWPPNFPSVPTSRATRVTSPANAFSWSTIVLMVFFSSRISPFTSTVILRDKSPRATAVVTSAMLRTWPVRFPAIEFTESVRSFHVPATPGTFACPPSRPSLPTSRATRVTSPANAFSWSTIVLIVSFSSRISPLTFTVIFFERSPLAIAVATSAMLRTWPVKLLAIEFTESVRSFHVPATPGTCACPPSFPSVPTSRATRVTSDANARNWSTIVFSVSLSSRISPLTSTVILRDKSPRATAVATSAMLRTWPVRLLAIKLTLSVRSFHVPATPGTCACPPSLPSVPTSRATRVTSPANVHSVPPAGSPARSLAGERVELIHHRVNGVFEFENFAFHIDRDLARQIAAGHSRCNFGNVTHLARKVSGHRIDGIRKIFPRTSHTGHVRLSAQAAFRTDFTRHARYFSRETVKLIHHRVQRFLQLQNLAANVNCDFARKIPGGDGGCHFGNISHLTGEVAGHEVDVIRKIFPRAANTRHLRLSAP